MASANFTAKSTSASTPDILAAPENDIDVKNIRHLRIGCATTKVNEADLEGVIPALQHFIARINLPHSPSWEDSDIVTESGQHIKTLPEHAETPLSMAGRLKIKDFYVCLLVEGEVDDIEDNEPFYAYVGMPLDRLEPLMREYATKGYFNPKEYCGTVFAYGDVPEPSEEMRMTAKELWAFSDKEVPVYFRQ